MEKKLKLTDWKALRKKAKRALNSTINNGGDLIIWYQTYCEGGLGYTALGRLIMQREK